MKSELQPGGAHRAELPAGESDDLARYLARRLDVSPEAGILATPLPDEPFAGWWPSRIDEARARGALPVLQELFPQLSFPVQRGMSRSPGYRAATLGGAPPVRLAEATGLPLEDPEAVVLDLYPSFAGRIPVIVVRHRADFATLVQALAKRNEPEDVPLSQGAAMVSGLIDWERIRELRRRWEALVPAGRSTATWAEEWAGLRARPELFRDRLVLLSDGPYSGVPASELGLSEARWQELSLVLRREHECAHYFTRRAYGSMRNHLLDELIADYAGMVAAVGEFRADWCLRFLGLRGAAHDRLGRRIEIYRGDPPLSEGACAQLATLVETAAASLERFDRERWPQGTECRNRRAGMVQALATLDFGELASPDAPEKLDRALARQARCTAAD